MENINNDELNENNFNEIILLDKLENINNDELDENNFNEIIILDKLDKLDDQDNLDKSPIVKIKYKFDRADKNIKICDYFQIKMISSYDFLVYKFGKSFGFDETSNTKTYWNIMVKTSNNFEYPIKIYEQENYEDYKSCSTDDLNKNNTMDTNWNISGKNYKFLDYKKLTRIFEFEYLNYKKKNKNVYEFETKSKSKSKSRHNPNLIINNVKRDKTKYNNIIVKNIL